MDNINYNTFSTERKRGKHLTPEDRGVIQALHKIGYSNRKIAKELNCSPSTIGYELKRGTNIYSGRGRKPEYSAKRGGIVYRINRNNCRRSKTVLRNSDFINWVVNQVRNHKWSFDICVGYARKNKLFPTDIIPCTKTLYNLLNNNELPLTLFDIPEALGRRKNNKPRLHKRLQCRSIEERPSEIDDRNTFGHWESDTVIGKKTKNEPAVFTIVERLTNYYLTIKIDSKTTASVECAINQLKEEFGDKFNKVFRSITTDNGSEFANFSKLEKLGTDIYFAHPYSSWERAINERSNRLLRKYIPKGKSISNYTIEEILQFSDEINSVPRKILDYSTSEELFNIYLDKIYAIN